MPQSPYQNAPSTYNAPFGPTPFFGSTDSVAANTGSALGTYSIDRARLSAAPSSLEPVFQSQQGSMLETTKSGRPTTDKAHFNNSLSSKTQQDGFNLDTRQ